MSGVDQALLLRVQDILSRAMQIARQAVPDQAQRKAHQDFVTNVDLLVDRFLEVELGALIDDCPVLSEERAVLHKGDLAQYWIVDPIDGTLNLMAGLPFYAIAVALVDSSGPRLAAVAAIGQDEIYTALRGEGAWLAQTRLKQPARPTDIIVLSTGLLDRLQTDQTGAYRALRDIGKIRNLGAQALHLCGVAQGTFAAVASVEARIWDEAAGGLILREAGAIWTSQADLEPWANPARLMAIREQRSIAAHPHCAETLQTILAPVFA